MRRQNQNHSRSLYIFAGLTFLFGAVFNAAQTMVMATHDRGQARPVEDRAVDTFRLGRVGFTQFNDRNGLPQNAIQAMAVDHQGYLWVGTQDGAAYYNGHLWTVQNMPDRTTSNFIRSILVASDGSLWFGRQEGGVSRLRDGHWTTFDEHSVLPDKRVNALLETRAGDGSQTIWVGTDKGLAQFNGAEWARFDSRSGLPDDRVTSLAETKDREGNSVLWVGTDQGLVRFSRNEWIRFDQSEELPQGHITSLLATTDETGRSLLWVGTRDGVGRLSLEENRWTTFEARSGFPTKSVVCLAQTVESNGERILWVGTDGGGLARYQSGNWSVLGVREGLPANSVFSLLPDEGAGGVSRTLWIGTDGGGLARLGLGGWSSFTAANGLPASSVFCIFETPEVDGSAMWFGTYGGGLARLKNGAWTIFDKSTGMPDNTVFEMLNTTLDDGERILWAGTKGGGLAHFENGRWVKGGIEQSFGETTVRSMLATTDEAGARVIWVASGNRGLGRLYKNKWTFFDETNGLPHKSVFEMAETTGADGAHILWVATGGGGLARYARNGWKVFDTSTGLPTNSVLSLHISHTPEGKQYLWAGTEGGGLARLELENGDVEVPRWTVWSDATSPALPNNTIYQIREDAQGRIYLSHNKGVTRLTPRPSPEGTGADNGAAAYNVYTFTTADGLPSNEGNGGVSFVDSKGRLWFGTVGGAAVFDPAQEVPDRSAKPLYIEHTLINGKPLALSSGQKLAHNENHLTFEYSLLSFSHEEGTRYRTQLVGFEKEPSAWGSDTKKDFTALPPGDYTFRVWGKDYAGNETQPASLSFTIRPALWRTWWAYALYALALGGLAFAGVRYRTKSLVRRNALLQAKVDERTHELAEKVIQLEESEQRASNHAQAKSQFLANMSHEIRTPINGVIGMTSLMLDSPLNQEQRGRAELVKRSGEMLLAIINDILDVSKIEAGKLELETIDFELTTAFEDVLELVARKAQTKGLELAGYIDPAVPHFLQGDPIRLRQILINLVDNAVKFTERGEVSVRVRLVEEDSASITLRFEVCDTGIGINQEAVSNLFRPFTQADNSTTRKYGGTGLGLTIAKQLVELMNGEIGADGSLGVGSRFWFTARFVKATAQRSLPPGQLSFQGRRALYTGKAGALCESVVQQLSAWQIETKVAHDGEGALSALSSDSDFDLLIIDSSLADMAGHELAKSIRQGTLAPDVPIILLTPLAERHSLAGNVHLLTKPIRRAQFYARLGEALCSDEVQAEIAAVGSSPGPPAPDLIDPSGNGLDWELKGPLKDCRLLLVEDNLTNQQVATAMLAQMGCQTATVANGREALAALAEDDYDLVFMDCHMPEMDGFEATTEIRHREAGARHTPIVAMTASALPEDRARCLAIGMDDYITKPLHRDELRAILERWLPGADREVWPPVHGPTDPAAFEPGPLKTEALRNLLDLGGANPGFLGELIDIFLVESLARLVQLREAAIGRDIQAVRQIAHTQRGACLNFGAQRMARLCAELETIRIGANPEAHAGRALEMIARIEQEFFRVRRALEQARLPTTADL